MKRCGFPDFLQEGRRRFGHAVWINGLNFLLTFGPLFVVLRLWLGPEGRWPLSLCVLVAGSLVYGVLVASARRRR